MKPKKQKIKKIIISPHFDDAFLSLAGFINQNNEDNFLIVNIFTRCKSPNIKISDGDYTKIRLEENKLASSMLKVKFKNLGFPEGLLRGYKKWNSRFNEKADEKLKGGIEEIIKKYKGVFYFPASFGLHHDHVLLRNLGQELEIKKKVIFYQEPTYVIDNYAKDNFIKNNKLKEIKINISQSKNIKEKIMKVFKSQFKENWRKLILEYRNNPYEIIYKN